MRDFRNFMAMTPTLCGIVLVLAGCASSKTGVASESAVGSEPVVTAQERAELENLNVPLRCRISWNSGVENGTRAFYIHRADNPQMTDSVVINQDNPVRARGYSQVPCRYYYYDMDVAAGKTMYYKCLLLNEDGTSSWIFGNPTPLAGTPRPIDAEDKELLAEYGQSFYLENVVDGMEKMPVESPGLNSDGMDNMLIRGIDSSN